MTLVLITRPFLAGQNLINQLTDLGYQVAHAPLLDIQATMELPPPGPDPQAVIITSGNAFGVLLSSDISGLYNLPCFCVGTETAQKAKARGFREVINADGDSKALSVFVQQRLKDRTAAILHITGQDTSAVLHNNLAMSGYKVLVWPVYKAMPAPELPRKIIDQIEKGQVNVVMAYSSRTADSLCCLIKAYKLETCCMSMVAIGISEAVCDILDTLSWKKTVGAPRPTENAMINALKEICPLPRGYHD